MIDTLITTVGASLSKSKYLNENFPFSDILSIKDPANERELGAEINSTVSIIEDGKIDERKNLYLVHSATVSGRKVSTFLKQFFESHSKYSFQNVRAVEVEGLDNSDQFTFRTKGLRNLIRELTKIYTNNGNLAINVTAGFKAQTSLALTFGFMMKVPVYYRYESFSKAMEIPPLPINFDLSPWLENKEIFDLLELNDMTYNESLMELGVEKNSFDNILGKLRMFIDIEKIDGEKYISLNPIGELYIFAVRNQLNETAKHIKLAESSVPIDKRFISNESEEHSKKFINKHWSDLKKIIELPFIEKVITTGYSDKFDRHRVAAKKYKDGKLKIMFSRKGGKLYMVAETTAKNDLELAYVIQKIENFNH